MKLVSRIIIGTAAFAAAVSVFAGGVDTKSNLSTGYLRNPSRNTEHERPEAVLYNIAGTGWMDNGLYFDVGNQFVFKTYSDDFNGKTYEDNKNVLLYPNAEIVFKADRLAVFGGFDVAGGGGQLSYNDGTGATWGLLYKLAAKKIGASDALKNKVAAGLNAKGITAETPGYATRLTTDVSEQAKTLATAIAGNHSLDVYSVTYGFIFGGAYKVLDNLSVSAAARVLYGHQTLELKCANSYFKQFNGGSDRVRAESFGAGLGGIFGVQWQPVYDLDVVVQYKTLTKLKMKYTTLDGTLAATVLQAEEGDKFNNDMPPELNLGVGYRVLDPVYVSASFNWYFNSQATITNTVGATNYDYNDSWECALGVDWAVNEKLTASLGGLYSKSGATKTDNNIFAPVLDNMAVGTGVEVKPMDRLTLTAGMLYTKYFTKGYENSGISLDLNKKVLMFSIGAAFKAL